MTLNIQKTPRPGTKRGAFVKAARNNEGRTPQEICTIIATLPEFGGDYAEAVEKYNWMRDPKDQKTKGRGVKLHLLDLGGDIAGNGISKLFLTIAAAFAEAERDRIRERVGQTKADQKARGRYLGGIKPFGYRLGEHGELVPHEAEQAAIAEMAALKAQGLSLRAIAAEMQARGFQISHEGVAGVLKARRAA